MVLPCFHVSGIGPVPLCSSLLDYRTNLVGVIGEQYSQVWMSAPLEGFTGPAAEVTGQCQHRSPVLSIPGCMFSSAHDCGLPDMSCALDCGGFA